MWRFAQAGRFRMVSAMKQAKWESTVGEPCERADPASPAEHLIVCPDCGQIFDCRDEAQVRHHA
jgi:Fe2+ or Zn2+ uptake regulation protein